MQLALRGHDVSLVKTQIIKCHVSHRRLFPATHRFAYPYLSVGIPVRSPTSSWLLSVDVNAWWRRGWLSVTAKDHLYTRSNEKTLWESLEEYLKDEALDPARFPYVYLLTSPRFLNYKFTPASFWLLYESDMRLAFVIAEVHNTFDERHMYLFPASRTKSGQSTCQKVFHVSPFSSRKGSYTLHVDDPAHDGTVSATVTLWSSKGHPKMTARLWSVEPALDVGDEPFWASLWFLASWGWMVLVTFIRILIQATMLAHRRGLSIWYRPEPRESSVPRRTTAPESVIASCFDLYMAHLCPSATMEKADGTTTTTTKQQRTIRLAAAPPELRIHTAQFYRHILAHGALSAYLARTLLLRSPAEENRTAWCDDDADGLVAALRKLEADRGAEPAAGRARCLRVAWAVYGRLRRLRPVRGAYPSMGTPKAREAGRLTPCQPDVDALGADSCFLDGFVRDHCAGALQLRYMASALYLQWRSQLMGILGGE
ncbi:hypothetical protein F4780DRAFT_772439 [Xylariomycetidae sp. FL0641]|nr:hypothetical protein F4780DRAFT_772439 [Xylariomycetidae sp. FL0641]